MLQLYEFYGINNVQNSLVLSLFGVYNDRRSIRF